MSLSLHVLFRTASLRATLDQWNADLQACADKSDAEGAKAKLEAMKAEGVEPDYLSYAGVVTACGRAGDGPGFKSYMSEMKENKVIAKNVEDGLKEKSSK